MMNMKKYISAFMIALTAVTMTACNKKVDVEAVSKTLPGLQLSSVGMFTSGPYVLPSAPSTATPAPVNTIQILFGATTTSKAPGAFDVFIYDSAAATVAVQTLHFNSWNSNDSFNTPSYGSISYTTVPTDYPNTTIYQGSIILKIPSVSPTYPAGSPLLTGKIYNVKLVAYSSDYTAATATTTSSTQSVTKLIAIQ